MHWKRLVRGAFWVALVILLVPLFCLVAVIVLIALLVIGIGRGIRFAWNSLPRHRRALTHAREAFAERCPGRIAVDWHVCRRARKKCIVRARLAGVSQPEAVWLCAVW